MHERYYIEKEKQEKLLNRKNVRSDFYNGIYDRYEYAVLTREHIPLTWRYDLDPGEEWYREQYKEASRRDSILYHPLFRRVVLIGIAVSMFVVGIAAAFFSALRV